MRTTWETLPREMQHLTSRSQVKNQAHIPFRRPLNWPKRFVALSGRPCHVPSKTACLFKPTATSPSLRATGAVPSLSPQAANCCCWLSSSETSGCCIRKWARSVPVGVGRCVRDNQRGTRTRSRQLTSDRLLVEVPVDTVHEAVPLLCREAPRVAPQGRAGGICREATMSGSARLELSHHRPLPHPSPPRTRE